MLLTYPLSIKSIRDHKIKENGDLAGDQPSCRPDVTPISFFQDLFTSISILGAYFVIQRRQENLNVMRVGSGWEV